jgi:hypothetical protein
MIPGELDITIQRGEDFSLDFTVAVSGVNTDFTGATVLAQIRAGKLPTSTLIADFVGSVGVDNETLNILLSDSVTSGISESITKGFYDVLVTNAGGQDRYYLRGKVTIQGSSTVKP